MKEQDLANVMEKNSDLMDMLVIAQDKNGSEKCAHHKFGN